MSFLFVDELFVYILEMLVHVNLLSKNARGGNRPTFPPSESATKIENIKSIF